MKKSILPLFLGIVVFAGCEKEQISPYQMRVFNQTDKIFWRVVSYYDGGSQQPITHDFGYVANKSFSEYIPVPGPPIPVCNEIEVTMREKSVRRPKEADCRTISFAPFAPGNYTLTISKLTDTGFDAVVKKD